MLIMWDGPEDRQLRHDRHEVGLLPVMCGECRECRVTVWRTADRMLIAFRRPATDKKGSAEGFTGPRHLSSGGTGPFVL